MVNGSYMAPEMGSAWLDLAATLRGRFREPARQTDLIEDPRALQSWLAARGLGPRRTPTAEDVIAAQRLRETVHVLARALATGQPLDPVLVRRLNQILRAAGPAGLLLRLDSGGSLVASRPADASEALARIARQAAADLTGPRAGRLRTCGDETCSGVFFDDTGRRRWCSDEGCGVRVRVRAHRARRAEREPPTKGNA
ncbi:MAG: ABATE domain-containing protein [Intrasporangium sp.]|uniref:CGNR zinc finger domain-containing protein n=1 Tax=Intrasporangium sp. TaxID=1925024 RepID=UPI002649FF32|nr:CGNR zinc finger domain-containing protein [Intrasporangium sp.]MDN5795707.1 ABATE domain-containing protein [Intrasporangium sp.]